MYIGTQPYSGIRARHTYTATAGQTSFSGAGAENVTLTYSDELYIDVYQNGVKLSPADYTATSGTTVVLGTGATVSDIVEVIKYDAFSVADTVSAKDGGGFGGNISTSGTLAVTGTSAFTGAVTANAGVVVDNITIDGTEIDLSSGDLTLDVAGNILLNADGGGVYFQDASTLVGSIQNSSSDLVITSEVQDKDIIFKGDDGGASVTALTLDMSIGGVAKFGAAVQIPQYLTHLDDTDTFLEFKDNQIDIYAGNKRQLILGTGEVIINQDSADVDFRVESNGNANTLFIEGSSDNISMGSSDTTPGAGTDARLNITTKNGGQAALVCFNAGTGAVNQISMENGNGVVGRIQTSGSATSFLTSSDYRLKENLEYSFDATTRLKQLKPCRFNFKTDADTTVDGFLAHEVSNIVPEAISGEKDAMLAEILYVDGEEIPDGKKVGDIKKPLRINPQAIDQSKLVPLLVKTLQEALTEIDTLKTKVAALEGE